LYVVQEPKIAGASHRQICGTDLWFAVWQSY